MLIFVNGCFIGRNNNGYAPFRFDLTDFLSYGAKNYIVARVDASFGDGWFYEGAGIYRHVWLTKTDALHLGKWESTVRTAVNGNSAKLTLGTVVENQGKQAENAKVSWQILDAAVRPWPLPKRRRNRLGRMAARHLRPLPAWRMPRCGRWTRPIFTRPL